VTKIQNLGAFVSIENVFHKKFDDAEVHCPGRRSIYQKFDATKLLANRIPSRFDKLEKRIDSLISNISQSQNENMLPMQTPPRDMATSSSVAKEEFESTHSGTRYQQLDNAVPDPPISLPAESIIPGENVWPQAEAAEALCYLFRNEMSMFFPFVTPPKGSVTVLQSNHPCLLKAMILAASYQNRSLQLRRGAALTEELAKRLLIDGEKSRDILQALLLTIAW